MTASLARPYTIIAIVASLLTMGLKFTAYRLTGSIGLLSDALESIVNIATSLVAFWVLSIAAQPPDSEHPFGHGKAEYFSSGLESALILFTGIGIIWTGGDRLMHPQAVEQIDIGIIFTLIATAINGGAAWVMLKAGRRLNSITLRADAHHLFSDVFTSIGLACALFLILITGWEWLDPVVAILVGINIIRTSSKLFQETLSGLMDESLPKEELHKITALFGPYEEQGLYFHLLQTRVAGSQSFISFHVLVPGDWTVRKGHDLCESLETAIANEIAGSHVTTHLEPIEDPKSWQHPQTVPSP